MSESRPNGGRARSRAFRPALDGRLEDRVLMSVAAVKQSSSPFRVPAQTPRRAHGLSAQTSAAIGE